MFDKKEKTKSFEQAYLKKIDKKEKSINVHEVDARKAENKQVLLANSVNKKVDQKPWRCIHLKSICNCLRNLQYTRFVILSSE